MSKSLYDVLGVSKSATAAEIKTTYRKLVLKYHPDTATEKNAAERFIEVTRAYEVLSDPARRREYDRLTAINEELRKGNRAAASPPRPQAQAKPQPKPPPKAEPKPPPPTQTKTKAQPQMSAVAMQFELERMTKYVSQGNLRDAELLAKHILTYDLRQPVAYAVLGDIARAKGDLKGASKMYAYAAQFDPQNIAYLRKHEQVLDQLGKGATQARPALEADTKWQPVAAGIAINVVAACFVALSPERPVFNAGTPISTWTVGLFCMLLFGGAAMGATLSLADYVDRFELTNAYGRISPHFTFMGLSTINLWLAAGVYLLVGGIQKGFVISITRMLLGLVTVVGLMTLGAGISNSIDPTQVMMWGGTLAALGATMGWAFADGLKH